MQSAALRWVKPERVEASSVPALVVASNGQIRSDLDQARLKTSVPFVPPNPNEFFSATSIFISRAVFAQ